MNQTTKSILWLIGIALLLLGLWYFRTIIAYVLVAAVLSFVGAPLVKLIKKIKIGRWSPPSWLAAALTLLVFVKMLALFFGLFAPLIAEEARVIAHLDLNKTTQSLEGSIAKTEEWLSQFNLSGDEQTNRDFVLTKVQGMIDFSQLSNVFNNIFSILGNAFIAIFSILFMAFFFLKDRLLFQRIVFTVTPDKHIEKVKHVVEGSGKLLTRYFIGVIVQVSIVAILISIGLSILGVKNAIIIGFLAGIFNLIPYIGPIIGALVGTLIALSTNLSLDFVTGLLPLAGGVLLVFLVVQLVDNFFTQPVILGNSVKAHPLEIFIVISLAASLAGILGMIVAIPVYTILRVVAKEFLSRFKIVEGLTRDI